MKIVHTLVGIVVLFAMVFAVDCLPGMSKTPQHPRALGDAGVPACAADTAPKMLCNATTKTSPPRECAICVERACTTVTGVWCSTSCDEPLCERRK